MPDFRRKRHQLRIRETVLTLYGPSSRRGVIHVDTQVRSIALAKP